MYCRHGKGSGDPDGVALCRPLIGQGAYSHPRESVLIPSKDAFLAIVITIFNVCIYLSSLSGSRNLLERPSSGHKE